MDLEEYSRLNHDDAYFLEKVMIDIRSFVCFLDTRVEKKEVLLFPPINNFRRFLIHQAVEQVFFEANLKTLSIGKLEARRTIVYHNSIEESNAFSNRVISPPLKTRELKSITMSRVSEACKKKSRKPDIQIYVPRGRRMLQTSPHSFSHQDQLNAEVEMCSRNYPEIDLGTTENWDVQTEEIDCNIDSFDRSANESYLIDSTVSAIDNCNASRTEFDLDYSEIENHHAKTNVDDCDSLGKLNSKIENLVLHPPGAKLTSQEDAEIRVDPRDTLCITHSCDTRKSEVIDLTSNEELFVDLTDDDSVTKNTTDMEKIIRSNVNREPSERNENTRPSSENMKKRNSAVHVEGANKSNDAANSFAISSIENGSSKSESPKTNNSSKKASECDWEELFNDSGDFVDETLIDELWKTVGKVRIQHAEQDYTPFQSTEERTSNGERIIEVHNFPADFKTDDLLTVFAQYRTDRGFQIVWVDDTHALAVFSSPIFADEVLNRELPFVKTRPLKNAIPKSRLKARDFVTPPATRPKTCVSLARRLVSNHLGMRISITDKQREAEKKLLSDAREKKRRIAKQKNDVWDDVPSDGR